MFGKLLRKLRIEKNITQNQLAELLNLSPSTIGMYEQGRRIPSDDIKIKIANFFDVSVDYLLGNSNTSNIRELEDIGDDSDIDDIYMYTLDIFNINTPYLRNAPLKDRIELLHSILEEFRPNEDNCELIFKKPKCFDNEIKTNLLNIKLQNMIKPDNTSFKEFKQFIEFIDDLIDKMNESNKE